MTTDPTTPSTPEPAVPPSREKWVVASVLTLLLFVAAGFFSYSRARLNPSEQGGQPAAPAIVSAPEEAAEPAAQRVLPPEPAVVLPALDQSDELFRDWARKAIGSAAIEPWLLSSGLVRRVVAVVARVADGESPAGLLPFLGLQGAYEVVERDGSVFTSKGSYQRYDAFVSVIGALDVEAAARTVRVLTPLFNQAWREVAPPGTTFGAGLAEGLRALLAVPVLTTEVELVEKGALWAYADPSLENLTPAQKHLLRMGPDNVRKLQGKLRPLKDALAHPSARR
jgi:hypothetical protein